MSTNPPTVVLVHGAFTNASVWNEVIRKLHQRNINVVAPAMPMRRLASDAAYLRSFLDTLEGPVVVVGHSYGGSIISCPDALSPGVLALVFVAAFQQDTGETASELNARFPGSKLTPNSIFTREYPGGSDLYLQPGHFADVYASDVDASTVAVMAAAQHPINPAALGETVDGKATWRSLPSWTLIATADNSVPTEAQRFMGRRAGSQLVEVDSSHAVPVSHPLETADLIAMATNYVAEHAAPAAGRLLEELELRHGYAGTATTLSSGIPSGVSNTIRTQVGQGSAKGMSVEPLPEDVLFKPLQLGAIEVRNRIFMAPLTRNRANHAGDVPTEMNARYYTQRATAGLLITEATQISPQGKGYQDTPGIYSDAQVAGWKRVTDAVHNKSGKIVLQLWHVGRVSHPSLQPGGALPVAPSAIAFKAKVFNNGRYIDCVTPRALRVDELPGIVDDFRRAAKNAMAAGFDGVEIHAANGYLLDQFLKDKSNQRTDEYGGSLQNRVRFPIEVVKAVCEAIRSDRVGIRIAPQTHFADVGDSAPADIFGYFVDRLSDFKLAYMHVIEGETGGSRVIPGVDYVDLRRRFGGAYIANNGYSRELAIEAIGTKRVDAVAFGVKFLANPDLVERFRNNAPLNVPDQTTFYGGDEHGYVDYPFVDAALQSVNA